MTTSTADALVDKQVTYADNLLSLGLRVNAKADLPASTLIGGRPTVQTLTDLDDTNIPQTPIINQVLTWTTNNAWEAANPTGGSGGQEQILRDVGGNITAVAVTKANMPKVDDDASLVTPSGVGKDRHPREDPWFYITCPPEGTVLSRVSWGLYVGSTGAYATKTTPDRIRSFEFKFRYNRDTLTWVTVIEEGVIYDNITDSIADVGGGVNELTLSATQPNGQEQPPGQNVKIATLLFSIQSDVPASIRPQCLRFQISALTNQNDDDMLPQILSEFGGIRLGIIIVGEEPTFGSLVFGDSDIAIHRTIQNLTDIANVNETNLQDEDFLRYNATAGEWQNVQVPISAVNFGDLGDVTFTNVQPQQIVAYGGPGVEWVNAELPFIATELPQLQDVTISNPQDGQILTYNTGQWRNLVPATPSLALENITDVVYSTPPAGQEVLTYNGTNWTNAQLPPQITTLQGLDDTNVSANPGLGNFLCWSEAENKWIRSNDVTAGGVLSGGTFGAFGAGLSIIARNNNGNYLYCGSTDSITGFSGSVVIGRLVGGASTGGNAAVILGIDVLRSRGWSATTGITCIGNSALRTNTADAILGSFTCAFGYQAGFDSTFTTGSHVLLGAFTGGNQTVGDSAICIGRSAGNNTTVGNFTIAIGRGMNTPENNQIAFGGAGPDTKVCGTTTRASLQTSNGVYFFSCRSGNLVPDTTRNRLALYDENLCEVTFDPILSTDASQTTGIHLRTSAPGSTFITSAAVTESLLSTSVIVGNNTATSIVQDLVCIGYGAGQSVAGVNPLAGARSQVIIGAEAGQHVDGTGITTSFGQNTIGIGYQCLRNAICSLNGVCIGKEAAANSTSVGQGAVVIGGLAGKDVVTGDRSICIGERCRVSTNRAMGFSIAGVDWQAGVDNVQAGQGGGVYFNRLRSSAGAVGANPVYVNSTTGELYEYTGAAATARVFNDPSNILLQAQTINQQSTEIAALQAQVAVLEARLNAAGIP